MASFRKANDRLNYKCFELMHQENFVDVSVVVDDGYINCHQIILATSSVYFQKIFKIIPNNKHPAVVLKDVSFDQLKLMIQFIYCGSVDIIPSEIEPFKKVLESLEIEFELQNSDEAEKVEEFDYESEEGEEDESNSIEADMPGRRDILDIEEPTWNDVKIKEEPKSDDESSMNPLPKLEKVETLPSPASTSTMPPRPKQPPTVHTSTTDHRYSQDPQRPLLLRRISIPKRFLQSAQPISRDSFPLPPRIVSPPDSKISMSRVVPSKKVLQFMSENPGKCPFCARLFKTSKHRNEHVKYCFDNPNRIVSTCKLCQKSVCDPYYLRKHMRNVHGIKSGRNT